MRTLIIPAAGKGSRFSAAGYTAPKPFIRNSYDNEMMVVKAAEPFLNHVDEASVLFDREHDTAYLDEFSSEIREAVQGARARVVRGFRIHHQPQGASMSVLTMQGQIPDDAEVIVINSDQFFDEEAINRWFDHIDAHRPDGSLLTFSVPDKSDTRWSFCDVVASSIDNYCGALVTRVVEKQHISDVATCGAYYFRRWDYLREAICLMVAAEDRTNNEFYLAPAYNYLKSHDITSYHIGEHEFHGVGTPELLAAWEKVQAEGDSDAPATGN